MYLTDSLYLGVRAYKLGLIERVKNKSTEQLSETVQEVTRPPKDPNKVKSKNIKVTEDCHRRLKEYLYHQRPNWTDVNEVGDVVEVILDEWEEKSIKRHD